MSSVRTQTETTFDALMRQLVADVKTPHQQKDERNKSIFSGFHGLSGGAGTTLDEQGRAHGNLTKECVRQVIANIQAQLYLGDDDKGFVRQMVAEINSALPCSLDALTADLVERGYLSKGIQEPKGLLSLAFQMVKSPEKLRFQNLDGTWFVSTRANGTLVNKVRSETQKIVGKYGICSVSGIITRLGLTNNASNRKFVLDVMAATNSITFLDDEGEWLTCDPGYTDRLTRRLRSVFSIYRCVDVETLYRVMARSLRQIKEPCRKSPEYKAFGFGSLKAMNEEREKENLPALNRKPFLNESNMKMAFSVDVFEAYLRTFPGLRLETTGRGTQAVADAPLASEDELSETIVKVIDLLDRHEGDPLRETEIKELAQLDTHAWYRFITASNFSPLISRVKRGTYQTLGEVFDGK